MVQLFVLVFEVLCVNLNIETEKSVCSDFFSILRSCLSCVL